MRRWLVGALLGSGVACLAYWRRALTPDGALVAAAVGCIVFVRGGLPAAGALLAFFGSSSALSRIGEGRKRALPLAQAKGARRDAWQVLANGGLATLCIAVRQPNAFLGALAAAGADTWATELGMLAKGPPRLITTLRRVPAGTSGGVTPAGLAASVGGAFVVGGTWASCGGSWRGPLIALLGGLGGSLADSLLGATVQAVYRCPVCGQSTEEPLHSPCGATTAGLERGYSWMNNDTVNALATLVGAAIGVAIGTPNAAGHVRGGS